MEILIFILFCLIAFVISPYVILASIFNWDRFFEKIKSPSKRGTYHRTIQRIVCLLVGIGFISTAIYLTLFDYTNSKFDLNYKQFKGSYILTTDFIETSNDSLKALKNMDENLVETELQKMNDSMNEMGKELNTKDEKGVYNNVKSYYQGIEFLLYASKNFDKLSTEEKRRVYNETLLAAMNRKSIKQDKE